MDTWSNLKVKQSYESEMAVNCEHIYERNG